MYKPLKVRIINDSIINLVSQIFRKPNKNKPKILSLKLKIITATTPIIISSRKHLYNSNYLQHCTRAYVQL